MRASTSRKNLTINFRFNKCKKIRKEKILFRKRNLFTRKTKKRKDEI